jgi:hypothetical protein
MTRHIRSLSLCFLVALAGLAEAQDTIGFDTGYANDLRREALSGSGKLDAAQAWTLQGSAIGAEYLPPGQGEWVDTSQLSADLGYKPEPYLSLGLGGTFGGYSSGATFGGGSGAIGAQGQGDGTIAGITVRGGTVHYAFGPGESLRQNSIGTDLKLQMGTHVAVGLSGDLYGYDRDLSNQSASTSGAGSENPPLNGLLGSGGMLRPASPSSAGGSSGSAATGSDFVADADLPGFPERDWAVKLALDPQAGSELALIYTPILIAETGEWDQVFGASFHQDLGGGWAAKAAWTKAIADGDGSPFFDLAFAWTFGA